MAIFESVEIKTLITIPEDEPRYEIDDFVSCRACGRQAGTVDQQRSGEDGRSSRYRSNEQMCVLQEILNILMLKIYFHYMEYRRTSSFAATESTRQQEIANEK